MAARASLGVGASKSATAGRKAGKARGKGGAIGQAKSAYPVQRVVLNLEEPVAQVKEARKVYPARGDLTLVDVLSEWKSGLIAGQRWPWRAVAAAVATPGQEEKKAQGQGEKGPDGQITLTHCVPSRYCSPLRRHGLIF